MPDVSDERPVDEAAILAIERPHPNLLKLYFLQALVTFFAFPLVFTLLYFKYHTLRYRFDDEGISAKWGILFRREIYLTYRRIQDIHVNRNLFERWLGIGKVDVQTASGSASAELVIEGMEDYEAVRDFLYSRMRGAKGLAEPRAESAGSTRPSGEAAAAHGEEELIALLRQIRDELEGARRALES
jgi:uncharacterized membrane protein YdbT with pleckstrin-like domain